MRPARATCPFCHAPVPLYLVEEAFSERNPYLVCPECDYLFPTAGALLTDDVGGASLTLTPEVDLECWTSD